MEIVATHFHEHAQVAAESQKVKELKFEMAILSNQLSDLNCTRLSSFFHQSGGSLEFQSLNYPKLWMLFITTIADQT
eukprot:scaffold176788_cov13-Tisochrysis_lutea.AAC.1